MGQYAASPPPPNNMWRIAESAALKSAAAAIVARSPDFLLSFHIHHGSPTLGTAQFTAELGC